MTDSDWKIGDRVEEIEQLGLAKIVDIETDANGQTHYHLRQFAHPHTMIWTDSIHISKPTERRHDPKYEPDHWY